MSGFEDDFNEPDDFGLALPDDSGAATSEHRSAAAAHHRQDEKPTPSESMPAHQESRDSARAVTVSNLQWWTADVELESLCGKYGEVTGLKFVEERSNCKSRGTVFIEFSDAEAASRCKDQMNGMEINGKTCMVTLGSQGVKFYFQQHTGRMAGQGNFRDNPGSRFPNRNTAPVFRGRGRGRYGPEGGHMNGMQPGMHNNPGMGMQGPMYGLGMPGIMGALPGPMGMGGMPMAPMGMPPFNMPGMFPPPMPGDGDEQDKDRKPHDRDRRDRDGGDTFRDRDYDRDRDYKRHRH